MNIRLRAAGQVVADDAKQRCTTTQAKFRVSTTVKGVSVVVTGPSIVGLLENGTGNEAPSWRHPVFGNTNVWVTQKTHPYLAPALEANRDKVVGLLIEALDETFAEIAGSVGGVQRASGGIQMGSAGGQGSQGAGAGAAAGAEAGVAEDVGEVAEDL
jgi:hypothetical protein